MVWSVEQAGEAAAFASELYALRPCGKVGRSQQDCFLRGFFAEGFETTGPCVSVPNKRLNLNFEEPPGGTTAVPKPNLRMIKTFGPSTGRP